MSEVSKQPDLDGKTCVITGATSGIGEVAAHQLAGMGAQVVVVGRSESKVAAVLESIRKSHPEAKVDSALCDFASFAQIRSLAADLLQRFPQIHVLVNNAGAVNPRRVLSEDGIERTFAVNHLGYHLLTSLLLERLKESAPARIVNVASGAHRKASMNFEDPGFSSGYNQLKAYGRSKLANMLFNFELARRLEGSGVTTNALHPGVVRTGIWNTQPGVIGLAMKLVTPFFITPEEGAETIVYLASSPEVEGVSGDYFYQRRRSRPAPQAQNEEDARRLWELSDELTGLAAGEESDSA